jgi:hypothetical protein
MCNRQIAKSEQKNKLIEFVYEEKTKMAVAIDIHLGATLKV